MTPRSRWLPLLAAVLVSAVLHATLLAGAWMSVPVPVVEPLPLEARLVAPAPQVQPPPLTAPAPAPRPARRPIRVHEAQPPRAIVARPAPDAATATYTESQVEEDSYAALEPFAAEEPPAPPPDRVAIAPPSTLALEPPPLRQLPPRGRISYTLYYGTEKFEVGRTVHTWEARNGRYRIGSVSETTGLVDVFRAERRTYLSEGAVTRAGLQPDAFLMSRTRRGSNEVARARFDWKAAQITWGTAGENREAALPAGSQDFLSLLFQLSLDPPSRGRVRVPITTGTRFEIYELDVLPEESIDTPLGAVRALPLRQVPRPGAETLQIWLAAEYRYLPVKVRFYGRDGAPSGEQIVNDIRLGENPRQEADPP